MIYTTPIVMFICAMFVLAVGYIIIKNKQKETTDENYISRFK